MKNRTYYRKYVDDLYYNSDSDFGNDDYGDGNFKDCGFGYDCEVSDENVDDVPDDIPDDEMVDSLNISSVDKAIKKDAKKLYAGKSRKEVLETWEEILRKIHSGTPDEANDGMTTAYLWLKDFVAMLADRKFSCFYQNDKSFRDDLIAAGNEGIIRGLQNYNVKKGMPTTYFYYPIIHEMCEVVKKTYGKDKKSMQNHLISEEDIEQIDEENRKVDTEAFLSDVEARAISSDQVAHLIKIIRKTCRDDIIYNCLLDTAINGIKVGEAAQKYNVDVQWLKDRLSIIKGLLQNSDEVLKLFPQFQPEGWREPPEMLTIDRNMIRNVSSDALLPLLELPTENIDRFMKLRSFHPTFQGK